MIQLSPQQLKELLVSQGIVDAETFDKVADEATHKKQNIADLLVFRGLVDREYFFTVVAQALGVERANLGIQKIDESVLRLLSEEISRSRKAIVFARNPDSSLRVAMEDPTNLETIDYLGLKLQARIVPYLATEEDLNRGFSLYEQKLTEDFKTAIEASIQESLRMKARGALKEGGDDLPIVALVENLVTYAVSSRASDVHFEILDDGVLVRYRIDGILHEIVRMPKEISPAVVARVKILANLRVDEHQHPQDGRFRATVGTAAIDIRVSIIPTYYGEKIELRLLTAAQKPLSLADLGFFEDDIKTIVEGIGRSYGMILACGPTGSGKTTTLYSMMNLLNRPEVNIMSIEDPIEYDMRYVNQMQVNVAAGITFAAGLRAALRQDPNIIMVGEIRDAETANIAVQAALTGHLVLSSLHTNDAPTAVPRLFDMGIPPFLVSAVLTTALAQRLVRKVHVECIESYPVPPEVLAALMAELAVLRIDPSTIRIPKVFYRGRGCAACGHTGYLGRLGLYEVMNITERIRKFILSTDFSLDKLRAETRAEGMRTMFEDGLRKVERGLTTIDEVFRVVRE